MQPFFICEHCQFEGSRPIKVRCLVHGHRDCPHGHDYNKCEIKSCHCLTPFMNIGTECQDAE